MEYPKVLILGSDTVVVISLSQAKEANRVYVRMVGLEKQENILESRILVMQNRLNQKDKTISTMHDRINGFEANELDFDRYVGMCESKSLLYEKRIKALEKLIRKFRRQRNFMVVVTIISIFFAVTK